MSKKDNYRIMSEKKKKDKGAADVALFQRELPCIIFVFGVFAAYVLIFRALGKSTCPLVAITGYPCPGCGLTRAFFRLLRLDFRGAFHMHPFIYPLIGIGMLTFYNRYFLRGRYSVHLLFLSIAIVFAMFVFFLWRFRTYFPDKEPLRYQEENLINRYFSGESPKSSDE